MLVVRIFEFLTLGIKSVYLNRKGIEELDSFTFYFMTFHFRKLEICVVLVKSNVIHLRQHTSCNELQLFSLQHHKFYNRISDNSIYSQTIHNSNLRITTLSINITVLSKSCLRIRSLKLSSTLYKNLDSWKWIHVQTIGSLKPKPKYFIINQSLLSSLVSPFHLHQMFCIFIASTNHEALSTNQ